MGREYLIGDEVAWHQYGHRLSGWVRGLHPERGTVDVLLTGDSEGSGLTVEVNVHDLEGGVA